jgi:murein DD-endopeptidase MepM/ murein hydrolase activator NlpD
MSDTVRPKFQPPPSSQQKVFKNWWELAEALAADINRNYDLWLQLGTLPSNPIITQYLQYVDRPIPKGKFSVTWYSEQQGKTSAFKYDPQGRAKTGRVAYIDYYEAPSITADTSRGAPKMAKGPPVKETDKNLNGVPEAAGPVPTNIVLEEAPPEQEEQEGAPELAPSGRPSGKERLEQDQAKAALAGQAQAAREAAATALRNAETAKRAAEAAVAAKSPTAPAQEAAAQKAEKDAKTDQEIANEATQQYKELEKQQEEARAEQERKADETPEGTFVAEPVYYDVDGSPFTSEAVNISQYSPYWVLIVVPYKKKVTASQKEINKLPNGPEGADITAVSGIKNAEESGDIIDLSNHCTSWRISNSKSSCIMNGSFTLVRPDVIDSTGKTTALDSYGTVNVTTEDTKLGSIKTQDWVMFWAMDNEADFIKVREAALNSNSAQIVNDNRSGLKFVGKIKSFKSTQTIASNGVIMKKYFIDAQAFSEFDNTIYYSQLAAVSDSVLSSKLGTLLNAFVLTPNSGLQVNTTQETIPFFTNLLFDMTLRDSLSQGLVQGGESLDRFLVTQAPNGPCIIPSKVYELLNRGKTKEITTSARIPAADSTTQGKPVFYYPFPNQYVFTSKFGPRWGRTHQGVDIGSPQGTPVYPSCSGTVSHKDPSAGNYGGLVEIDHGGGYTTRYAHLSQIRVSVGDQVNMLSPIGSSGGEVGSKGAGNSKGAHLHFEIREGGNPVDPKKYTNINDRTPYARGAPLSAGATTSAPVPASSSPPPSTKKASNIYTYVDILYQYIGITTKNVLTENQTSQHRNYYQSPIEIVSSAGNGYPLDYTNTFKVGEEMDATLLVQTIHFDSRPIWQILKAYLNEPVNEIFTSIRMNHEGRIYPTFICRQIPFSTQSFKKAHSDTHKITQYVDIPKWYIPMSNILTYDVGYSDGLNVNYVRLKLQSTIGDSSAAEVNYMYNVSPALDSADIMRNGLRMYNVICTSGIGNVAEAQKQGQFWTKLIADFVFRLKYQINGHVTCKGIQKPVSIGDNVIVNGVMFHIEGMTHEGGIDMSGKKKFNTTMSLTHGESLNSFENIKVNSNPVGAVDL